ncbi:MAG: hypothetical protein V1809_00510 [Planctomycetota bacterium]
MSYGGLFLWLHVRMLANSIATLRRQSRLKIAVLAGFFFGFVWGLYGLFSRVFGFLIEFDARPFVVALFSLFFLAMGLMLTVSNAIIAFASFFRSPETAFLLASPLEYRTVCIVKGMEAAAFGSWAFFLLAGPMLVAYGVKTGAPPAFYAALVFSLAAFALIPAGAGTLLGALFGRLAPRRRRRAMAVIGIAAVAALLFAALRLLSLEYAKVPLSALWMREVLDKLSFCEHPLLPSYGMAHGLTALAERNAVGEGEFYFLVILANGLFAVSLASLIVPAVFPAAWSRAQGTTRSATGSRLFALAPLRTGMARQLFLKDLVLFVRDPRQWSQFAIFFGLLAIYVFNLRRLTVDITLPFWRNLVAFVNLGATCLTLATLTTRFVYPSVSLEGRRFWVLGLLPLNRGVILLEKFAFGFLLPLAAAEGLVTVSGWMLEIPARVIFLHQATVLLVAMGLSGLAAGLGAAFPNTREEDPSKIVSSFGGTLTLILSLGYVCAVVVLEAVPFHLYMVKSALSTEAFHRMMIGAVAGTVFLTALAVGVPLAMGWRALKRMEF